MKINILTLYPEMFPGCLGYSLAGRALNENKWSMNVVNIRDFATDKYKSVDDTPFGGGAGMVMKPEVLDKAIASVHEEEPIFYLSPRGKVFSQKMAHTFANMEKATFICGRFEGIDAVIRLIPSVMGNADSLSEESFSNGLLEYPQYTKPAIWQGKEVPDILLSGHHANIAKWRRHMSEEMTKQRRPDLWTTYCQK